MSNLAEKKLEYLKKDRTLYLASEKKIKAREENVFLYYNSGVFPIFLIIVLLLCFVVLLNVGLRMQFVSYDRQVYELERIISLEEERSDRLNLKIAELRSPNRIITDLGVTGVVSNVNFRKININNGIIGKNDELKNYSAKDNELEIRQYKSLTDAMGNAKDIIMVVSESVLTFFIP